MESPFSCKQNEHASGRSSYPIEEKFDCLRESSALSRASPAMNIHEYQAKELLEKFRSGDNAWQGRLSPREAEQIARELAPAEVVVKAQVHAGGRGKGTFTKRIQRRGARLQDARRKRARLRVKMLRQTLVTHQTGPAGSRG